MSKKIEAYQSHVQTGILLNANESPYGVTESVMGEIVKMIPNIALNRYPDDSYQDLYRAYANVMQLDCDQLIAGNGSDQMLDLVMSTYLDHTKKLYTIAPDFGMFDYYASRYEADIKKFVTEEDGSFDVDAFIEKGRREQVDLVVFSNPNNPTGHCLSVEQVERIIEGFDCPVLVDEAYMEFSDQSVLERIETYANLMVTRTLSKAYGLAGLRVGFLVSNKNRIAQMRAAKVPYALNTVSQKIAEIVLRHYEDIQIVIEQTKSFRDEILDKALLLRFLEFYPSQANFIYGRADDKALLLKLFSAAGIAIRDFKDTDHFRISIGSKQENEAVLDVLTQYVKEML